MSKSIGNIKKIMRKMGVYQLGMGGSLEAELSAYEKGFGLIEEKMSRLLNRAFVMTCDEDGLSRFEQLLGIPSRNQPETSIRKQVIQSRLVHSRREFNLISYIKILGGAGYRPIILEDSYAKNVNIKIDEMIDPTLTFEEMIKYTESVLPAHINCSFTYHGLSFDELDSKVLSWDFWDGKDFDWNSFDTKNHEIFT